MSCYFRHLKPVFDEAGVMVTPANKKQIDMAFHEAVGVKYKNCPETWRSLKPLLADQSRRKKLVNYLRNIPIR